MTPSRQISPSAWCRRGPILTLSLSGFAVASYLALYQWGVFGSIWDPLFGADSSRAVLHSSLAQRLPFPDAALGAAVYLIELIADLVGGPDRWHAMPWTVAVMGGCAAAMGVASIVLVLLQPLAFHHWCALCLVSAVLSLTIVALARDEVIVTISHLRNETKRGIPLLAALRGDARRTLFSHRMATKGGQHGGI